MSAAAVWTPLDELPDPLREAYSIYRAKRGFLDSGEIRAYRERIGLSQKVLAAALGMSYPTLSRYESGALPEGTYDNLIRLAMGNPGWMAEKIARLSDDIISAKKKRIALDTLREAEKNQFSSYKFFEQLQKISPSEFNGFTSFSAEKVRNFVLFLIKSGVTLKGCIYKDLWLADSSHYADQGVSIAGLSYCRHNYGPIPDDQGAGLRLLIEEGYIEESKIYYPTGQVGYSYEALVAPDMSVFNAEEAARLQTVVEKFSRLSATDLKNLTHEQRPWKETQPRARISFHLVDGDA